MADVAEEVARLIELAIPEGPSLEYKQALSLGRPADRLEAAKDISGMGNGGGGQVVYGVAERVQGFPDRVTPLTELRDIGRLEDIVRTGIHPPLLATFRTGLLDTGGHVLIVDIQRSPLGPYMVEAFDQCRYFTRIGSRTAPMSEQQVRDAYLLAVRGRERRAETWDAHALPPRTTGGPWLRVSGLPEEPLTDLWDPASMSLEEFRLPDEYRIQRRLSATDMALQQSRIFAHGMFGEYGENRRAPQRRTPQGIARIHRDGAIGLAQDLPDELPRHTIVRSLNAELFYLAWTWGKIALRTPAELVIELIGLARTTMPVDDWRDSTRSVLQPTGVTVDRVELRLEVLHRELARAGVRHGIVHRFADRLHQAFGLTGADPMFLSGWLFGSDGRPIGLSLFGDAIWPQSGQQKVAFVYRDGLIEHAQNNQRIAGYVVDGAVLDERGDTMALLELAEGPAVPDGFLHQDFYVDPRARTPSWQAGEPVDSHRSFALPSPTGHWSGQSLATRLESLDW